MDFDITKLKQYARQIPWASGRDGKVWQSYDGHHLPDLPIGLRKTNLKNSRGEYIFKDAGDHAVNADQPKSETRSQEQQRRLAEAKAEVQREIDAHPVNVAQRKYEQTARALDKATRLLKKQELEQGCVDQELLALCSVTNWEEFVNVDEMLKARDAAVKSFEDRMKRRGIKLSDAAFTKLGRVVGKHASGTNLDITEPSNIEAIFGYLDDLGFFTADEITRPAPVAPTPEPVDPLELMERTNDPKELRKLAEAGMVAAAKPPFTEFCQFIAQNYKVTLTEDQKQACIAFAVARGSFSRPVLDEARRVVLGLFTAQERLAKDIEDTNVPLTGNYQARVDLRSRQRQINEGF